MKQVLGYFGFWILVLLFASNEWAPRILLASVVVAILSLIWLHGYRRGVEESKILLKLDPRFNLDLLPTSPLGRYPKGLSRKQRSMLRHIQKRNSR
jgi:hypothetical protein